MKVLKHINFLFLLTISVFVQGQELSNYYSYLMNPINLNTAYTGSEEKITGILNSRTQWVGVDGAPRNLMFGLHGPIFKNQGMGVRLISDSRGSFQTLRSDFMYSHRFAINEKLSFRMGLSAGVVNRRIGVNTEQQGLLDNTDPSLYSDNYNHTNFVSGFGLLANWKGLQLGFSAPHMIENDAIINQHLVGIASYCYAFGESKWEVQPILIYQNLPVIKNQLDMTVKGIWAKKVWAQATYKTNGAFAGAVGFNLKGFGIGYLYEQNAQPLQTVSQGTHEIALTFSITHKPKSFGSLRTEKELDGMIDYVNKLLYDEKTYGKEFILSEIERIYEQLNKLTEKNSHANAAEVKHRLDIIEEQVKGLIERYKLRE